MGQLQYDAGLPDPLGLSGRYEVVDDALGRVGKVAELRLPDDQLVVGMHRVAQLEPQNPVFGERTVPDAVMRLKTRIEREKLGGGRGRKKEREREKVKILQKH